MAIGFQEPPRPRRRPLSESNWLAVAGRLSAAVVAAVLVPALGFLAYRVIDTGDTVSGNASTLIEQGKQVDRLVDAQADLTEAQSALTASQATLTANQSSLTDAVDDVRATTKEQIIENRKQIDDQAAKIEELSRRIDRLQLQIGPARNPFNEQ